jgi:hypothetical protein
MEHVACFHITFHFPENPAYHRKLREKLEEILVASYAD